MILCFECDRSTKAEIDRLLVSGKFTNLTELLAVAVANLGVLQGRIGANGAVFISGAPQPARDSAASIVSWNSMLLPVERRPQKMADLPQSAWPGGQVVPLTDWIFGQFNRLLPAKFNCRMLAHMLQREPNGIPLSEAQSIIAQHAASFGDHLAELDRRYQIERDDALATAFPHTGPDSDKGRLRYANQFVANSNKSGQLSGLLTDFKLINATVGREPRLLLTEPGWQFAKLSNPIIEGRTDNLPPTRLTLEEQEFLIAHINQNVPVERSAYSTIIRALVTGAITPNELDGALRKSASPTRLDNTSSFLSSQRSGAISRMADLGLIVRVRDGVRVSYDLTQRARELQSHLN